jgi:TonB family protein
VAAIFWQKFDANDLKTFVPALPDLNRVSTLAVFTLVLWLGCVLVGALGLILPYRRPLPPKPAPPPVKVELLNVELSNETQPPEPPKTVIPPDALTRPDIPPPVPVAEPSPAIAFALPVAGPVRVVAVNHAAAARPAATAALPAPQKLTFGQGEGRQPAPDYPPRARREGQQGNVTIRFAVAADGQVTAAEVISPSPWELLNAAALRAVRERWRFPAGAVRVYDVVIRFELRQ